MPSMTEKVGQPRLYRMTHAAFWEFIEISIFLIVGMAIILGLGLSMKHKDNDNLTSQLLSIRSQYQLPALTIGRGDATSFARKTVGARKEGTNISALATDIYHLGLLTKAMTATLLAILVQDNTNPLSWTSTLPEMLPDFNVSSDHSTTTLQDLTSHRSGITDDFDNAFFLSLYSLTALEGRWTVTNRSLSVSPSGKLGTYTYANTNYIIAGVIIDALTSSPAESFFASHLFTPLQMHSPGWGACPETSNTSIDNPWPHTPSPSGPIPVIGVSNWMKDNPPAVNTAGRAHMTPADYNAFLQLHLAAMLDQSNNPLNLSLEQFNHLHTAYPSTNTSDPGYGYTYGGWLRQNLTVAVAQRYVLLHSGSNRLNYAWAELDNNAAEAYMSLTNVGGNVAAVGCKEAILGMQNGTLIL